MADGWIHTVYRDGLWVNEVEAGGSLTRHESKTEAVETGRETARRLQTTHVIHRPSGPVAETFRFGSRADELN